LPPTCAGLIAEIEGCGTLADLNRRAAQFLKAKNQLSSDEAKKEEAAFTARFGALEGPSAEVRPETAEREQLNDWAIMGKNKFDLRYDRKLSFE
jgi:hypothetical protein